MKKRWFVLYALLFVATFLFQEKSVVVLEAALFTGVFLLLVRLRHSFGVGSSIIIPPILVTALIVSRFYLGQIPFSKLYVLLCFSRYFCTALVFLVALAISGKRTFLARAYNGMVSSIIIWVIGSLGISFFSPQPMWSIEFYCGQAFLGGAMGLFLMIGTYRPRPPNVLL